MLTQTQTLLTSQAAPVNKPIILIVDDEKQVRESIVAIVSLHLSETCRIEEAEGGREALGFIAKAMEKGHQIALIICDQLFLPGDIMGDETLILAHQQVPKARTIMITGQASMENVANAINKADLYRFIAKPWHDADLQLTAETAVQGFLQDQIVEEQNRLLRSLYQASQEVARQGSITELVLSTLRLVLEFTLGDRALLFLNEGEQLYLQGTLTHDGKSQVLQHTLVANQQDLPTVLLQRVSKELSPLYMDVRDASELAFDPYFTANPMKVIAAFPILVQNHCLGVLYVETQDKKSIGSQQATETLQVLAGQTGTAIDTAYLRETFQRQLEDRSRELLAALSHKDEMVRIVSHDIRSPLTGIQSLMELMQDPEIISNQETVVKYSGIVLKSVQTVIKLVNDILDLSKLESGSILVSKTEVELLKVLKSGGAANEATMLAKGLALQYDAPKDIIAMADEGKLLQALNNLITNSVKFTNKGGTILLGLNEVKYMGKPYACLSVSDSGIGIPADVIPSLFDKFGKAQRAGTKGEKGTGLGLSIVKELIELQDGTVTVASEIGKGTTFSLLLPLGQG
jgi:signal transduction histidine kinase